MINTELCNKVCDILMQSENITPAEFIDVKEALESLLIYKSSESNLVLSNDPIQEGDKVLVVGDNRWIPRNTICTVVKMDNDEELNTYVNGEDTARLYNYWINRDWLMKIVE